MAGEIYQVASVTDYFVGQKVRGSQRLKWPSTHYGVVAHIGDVKRDGSEKFDVDAAMKAIGWQRIRDTGREDEIIEIDEDGNVRGDVSGPLREK